MTGRGLGSTSTNLLWITAPPSPNVLWSLLHHHQMCSGHCSTITKCSLGHPPPSPGRLWVTAPSSPSVHWATAPPSPNVLWSLLHHHQMFCGSPSTITGKAMGHGSIITKCALGHGSTITKCALGHDSTITGSALGHGSSINGCSGSRLCTSTDFSLGHALGYRQQCSRVTAALIVPGEDYK
jgi:hypothetical protein